LTTYSNTSDVTFANSSHKFFLELFDLHLCPPPTLKKTPPPMLTENCSGKVGRKLKMIGARCSRPRFQKFLAKFTTWDVTQRSRIFLQQLLMRKTIP